VYDGVIKTLTQGGLEPGVKYRLLESAVEIVRGCGQGNTSLKLGDSIDIRASVSDVPNKTENQQKVVRQFLGWFTDCKCKFISSCIRN